MSLRGSLIRVFLNKTKLKNKSERTVTASVLKRDPNTRKVQKNAIYSDKTQHANFRGDPL